MVSGELDLLPEEVDWRDVGCGLFPSCLHCPLPRCIEEEPGGRRRLRMSARAGRMAELRRDGRSVEDIAGLFGVSRRTVQRALRTVKSQWEETEGIGMIKQTPVAKFGILNTIEEQESR